MSPDPAPAAEEVRASASSLQPMPDPYKAAMAVRIEQEARWYADPAPDYIVVARGLGRLYGARSYEERRRREQDAAYILTLLREAGYETHIDGEEA